MHHTSSNPVSTVCSTIINGKPIINFSLRVLWRIVHMVIIIAVAPPTNPIHSNVASGTRRSFALAACLSHTVIPTATALMTVAHSKNSISVIGASSLSYTYLILVRGRRFVNR